jgi:hypothetical protein
VIATLEAGGVRVVTRTMKEVGHDLPESFAVQASEVLRALRED